MVTKPEPQRERIQREGRTARPTQDKERVPVRDDPDILLRLDDVTIYFDTYVGTVKALDGVDLTIRRHETLGLVGESGCGKSVTAMSVLRLLPTPPARLVKGRILFRPDPKAPAVDLARVTPEEIQAVRGNDISMIFQEPMTSLNPVMRVGDQIAEAVLRHQTLDLEPPSGLERALEARRWFLTGKSRERRRRARNVAIEMLKRIGMSEPEQMVDRYPHELSGGMRQRIMIAMALACRPALLIADEPTTALDVTIQAQIMDLMKELKKEEEASILLITHHLGVVAEMCDRVAVMYAGNVVETAPTRGIYYEPAHPYTVGLLKSIPDLEGAKTQLPTISGTVPDLVTPPAGCRFHPRCPYAMEKCKVARPPLYKVGEDHYVACVLYDGEQPVPVELRTAGLSARGPPAAEGGGARA